MAIDIDLAFLPLRKTAIGSIAPSKGLFLLYFLSTQFLGLLGQ
jgi:hypothetical protein